MVVEALLSFRLSNGFIVTDRLPNSREDFKERYWNADEERDESSYLITESEWKKLRKHRRWADVIKEYKTLAELQAKREELRKGSTDT